jgi:hypothetical protein
MMDNGPSQLTFFYEMGIMISILVLRTASGRSLVLAGFFNCFGVRWHIRKMEERRCVMFTFETITVIVVFAIFAVFAIAANKAEKVVAEKAKALQAQKAATHVKGKK